MIFSAASRKKTKREGRKNASRSNDSSSVVPEAHSLALGRKGLERVALEGLPVINYGQVHL